MHGLINRSIQCFLRDTYGAATWTAVAREARLGFDSFEPMLNYDPLMTDRVLSACVDMLGRPLDTVLEDIGIYLVSHPNILSLRRLLRFGGVTYTEFIQTIEDLPERGRLALPDLRIPRLDLTELPYRDPDTAEFMLYCYSPLPGAGHVIVGVLRAMADDYGVLSVVEHRGRVPGYLPAPGDPEFSEQISITVAETSLSAGRRFELSMGGPVR